MTSTSFSGSFLPLLKKNWKAGLTVALVSIPLSISLSIATNAPPTMGIITAIWAGIVASIFGGSNFNIIGPAAALSGVLAGYAHAYGAQMLPWISVGSGALILLVWALRWDKYILFIPGSVIHGFTLAVGLIIALNQLNFVLGLSGLPVHEAFLSNIGESLRHIQDAQVAAVVVSMLGLVFLLLWNRYLPGFPGPIPLAAIGIGLGFLTSKNLLPFSLQTLQTKFGVFDTALIQLPTFTSEIFGRPFIVTTFTVALIAILETLLSAKIADGMTRTRFKQGPETLALGLANIVAGFCGGLPATGVLARTALNAKSGATHRISQGINAVSIAIICMLLLGQFIFLPLPIIAAILIYTAYRMVHHEHFIRLYRDHRTEFFLSIFVAAISVAFDPMVGILVGTSLAMMLFVQKISTGHAEVVISHKGVISDRMPIRRFSPGHVKDGEVCVYRFSGSLTHINVQAHRKHIQQITGAKTIVLAFNAVSFLDCDGIDGVSDIVDLIESKNMEVALAGVESDLLRQTPLYARKTEENMVFPSVTHALQTL